MKIIKKIVKEIGLRIAAPFLLIYLVVKLPTAFE